MKNGEFKDFLIDIAKEIENLEKFLYGLQFEDFKKDEKTTYACIRSLEIIGEATKHVPDEIKKKYPKIPWKHMAGMRDILIHDYFGVDVNVIWKTIKEDIPEVKLLFKRIMEDQKIGGQT